MNVESVDNVAGNVFENVIGNVDDDRNWVEVGNRDMDEGDDDDACNLVDVEQSSDNDNFEMVDARRDLKEFSARLKTKTNIKATSQLDVSSPIELAADPLIVNASGYETKYYHSYDEKNLHSSLDNKDEEEEDDGISRRRSRFPSYNRNGKNLVFVVSMTFENAIEFKDAILRYSVVEQKTI